MSGRLIPDKLRFQYGCAVEIEEMADMQDPSGIRRSRRNLLAIGTIATTAVLGSMKTHRAHAQAVGTGQNGPPGGQNPGQKGQNQTCFLKGTRIRAADGDKKIEDLAVGNLLPTVFGGARPIQWIDRYRFKRTDPNKAWVKDVLPVRISRSALGRDVPHADLFVTKGHSLLIDDVLVPVCNLINDTTIAVYDARALDELEFFHIRLEAHDVIYAEGAPCETLLDVNESAINFAEYLREYGPPISQTPCAPMFGYGRRVEIKSRLRSAISPWYDCRQKLDIIRDKLEEGEPLLRQSELVS
jgi:hypothetical protein